MDRQYIGFRVCEREFALDILAVQEIIRGQELTSVPQSDCSISGVFSLRGTVIPVVSFREIMGLAGPVPEKSNIMVVNAGGAVAGLEVEDITGVIPIPEERVEPIGKLAEGLSGSAVSRVARLEDRLILLPDAIQLVTGPERGSRGEGAACLLESELRNVREGILARGGGDLRSEEDIRKLIGEVQNLMNALMTGNFESAESAIDALKALGEKKLFAEVGTLTRKLHESLNDFRRALDPKIKAFATRDMPEAADSLEQVIALTEDSANRTLALVEQGLEDTDVLRKQISSCEIHISRLKDAGAAPEILEAFESTFANVAGYLERTGQGYNDILMSQDFQDLTGQMIRRIIKLVRDLEGQLVELVRNFGVDVTVEPESEQVEMKGPASSTRIAQDDVDNLLASFGF